MKKSVICWLTALASGRVNLPAAATINSGGSTLTALKEGRGMVLVLVTLR